MKDKTEDKLLKSVMEKIEKEEVAIKPRIYFVLGSLFLGFILALLIPLSIFYFGVTFFQLRVLGGFSWLEFGALGIKPFLLLFPWLAIVLALLSIGIVIKILTWYDVSYKWNFMAVVLFLFTFSITSAWITDQNHLHEKFKTNRYLSCMYHNNEQGDNFLLGTVESIDKEKIFIKTLSSGSERVLHLKCGNGHQCDNQDIYKGDKIKVLLEDTNNNTPHIFKIRKFQNRDNLR